MSNKPLAPILKRSSIRSSAQSKSPIWVILPFADRIGGQCFSHTVRQFLELLEKQ
jgi:hypothetical protein